DGLLHEPEDRARAEAALVSVALCPRPHHDGGDQRPRLSRDRCLRPSACAPAWRTPAARGAMEVRIQIDQVDRAFHIYRHTPEGFVGGAAGVRIRLLGQPQSPKAAYRPPPGDP